MNCPCQTVGVPPIFRGLGITPPMRSRTRTVGDLWSSVGSIFSGLGTVAGAILPSVLGPGTAGNSGAPLVVANPINPTHSNLSSGSMDPDRTLLYVGLGLGALYLLTRKK